MCVGAKTQSVELLRCNEARASARRVAEFQKTYGDAVLQFGVLGVDAFCSAIPLDRGAIVLRTLQFLPLLKQPLPSFACICRQSVLVDGVERRAVAQVGGYGAEHNLGARAVGCGCDVAK